MVEFIILFFPTFISLNLINKRNNLEYKELLLKYPVNNLMINVLSFLILYLLKGRIVILFGQVADNVGFAIKYILLASFISCLIPYVEDFLKKNINIKIKIRRLQKNEESN